MLRTILLELFLPFRPFKKTANIRCTTTSAQILNSHENKTKGGVAPKRKTGAAAKHLLKGQPSLTSVERLTFYLRSDFVNVIRHAHLITCDCFDRPLWFVWWSDGLFGGLVFLFRSSLDWFNQKMPLHPFGWMMFQCFASIKPLSASRSFQWMLLSKIPWMALHGMTFKKNYRNKQKKKKLKWTAASSTNFIKILAGIIENYPYGKWIY